MKIQNVEYQAIKCQYIINYSFFIQFLMKNKYFLS